VPTINYHIKKVFEDSELQGEATIRKFLIVQSEGGRKVSREVEHYWDTGDGVTVPVTWD
jgi:hypothetical protein